MILFREKNDPILYIFNTRIEKVSDKAGKFQKRMRKFMKIQKSLFLFVFYLFSIHSLQALSVTEQFKEKGYLEIYDHSQSQSAFNDLYRSFDELIEFLQLNPICAQKLYMAKERFIRSKNQKIYSTDFFGLYDESKKEKRRQISFYYSTHFHEYICSQYPEFKQVPELIHFLELCFEIQKPYENVFRETANEMGLETIFSTSSAPPLLFKVIKYLPSYTVSKPHYDGSAFSLFLHSTDNQSLLLSPYKSSFTIHDFASAERTDPDSILLIPGAFLSEFSIDPTPHIVVETGKTRYAAIAFAMRSNYIYRKKNLSLLPPLIVE